MTIGDPMDWDNLFEDQLIPTVLSLVLDAWDRMAKPAADEREDITSDRLFREVVSGKDRNRHPFLVRREDMELDPDPTREHGWKDIVFFPPANDENVYFCLEAKRLNARIGRVMNSLADRYVKEGMQRYVDARYSRHVLHGGMLGYVLDGDVVRAMSNVAQNIRTNHPALGMDAPGDWTASPLRPADPNAKETRHKRSGPVLFRIHHLFVAGILAAKPLRGRKPSTKTPAEPKKRKK
jgi:hypothetical protein